ncbi:MAG: ABC transporter ATP-binding protein [Desulfovibrionaceae bacterium]|nr:ABC transporter ATP-binding protein [Desulfovibrionaceae bacterium]
MNALTFEDFTVTFAARNGSSSPVRGVNLHLAKGRTLAIVGESGSGKTLTGTSALGLLPDTARTSGRIFLDDNPIHALSEKELTSLRGRRISIIMQEPMAALNPIMTVGRQVEEGVRLRSDAAELDVRQKLADLFREVGLNDVEKYRSAYPHEMSGGQLQRVMIAMALARDPEVLIADEPTTALDVTIQRQILQLLSNLQRSRRMAILFVSHDIAVVAQIAHDVAVMCNGEIVEYGTVEDVLRRPRHPYTRRLLASHPEGRPHKTLLPISPNDRSPAEPKRPENGPAAIPAPARKPRQVLRTSGLEVVYSKGRINKRSFVALRGVDVTLNAGETLGIVGESGSGKSSLAKAILGIAPVTAGHVELFGKRLDNLPVRERAALRRRCQIVFQNSASSLNPRLNVLQLLAEPYLLHAKPPAGTIEKSAGALLEEVGLPREMLNRYPHELSGGQRQRVNIARALASDPEMVICDEAVSALDISAQAQVINLLLTIQRKRRLAMLFISHDLQVTQHVSDRICVVKDGAVMEEGPAQSVFSPPRCAYTRNLVAASPSLHGPDGPAPGMPAATVRGRIAERNASPRA